MPTIEVKQDDLESLLGEKLDRALFPRLLALVKGEVKAWTEGALKLELNDSNRPDLWSPEGIARQIRIHQGKDSAYPFFAQKAEEKMYVSKEVMAVRPYLAGFIVRGVTITESVLAQLIQSQEKLADIFGQKRKSASIGLYRVNKIAFPVRYDLADPDTTRLTPLGMDDPMSFGEILHHHPKGIAYGSLLKGQSRLPVLMDAKDQVLSFPPIINSREMGEVCVGDTDLLVEVTGTHQRMVILAANIFACNLFDRGGTITPVEMIYPQQTDFGTSVTTPHDFSKPVTVTLGDFQKALGEQVSLQEVKLCLLSYGYKIDDASIATAASEGEVTVTLPPYRDDFMHPIDIVEDFAISRGFDTFLPTMPVTATIGSQSSRTHLANQLANAMVGFGFEEVISNVLSSSTEQIDRMRMACPAPPLPLRGEGEGVRGRPEQRVILLENPMTERHAMPRSWLLPSLLRVEAVSSKTYYPHRLFEIGEVAQMTATGEGCETAFHLAALIAYAEARFSDLHAVLATLFNSLSVSYRMAAMVHPTLIEGRSGLLLQGDQEIGWIGEIHPEVLTKWEIGMPAVAFELDITLLSSANL
jgi:phenylalanyl-tRNA synthetase beta chain